MVMKRFYYMYAHVNYDIITVIFGIGVFSGYPSPKGRIYVPREYCQETISSNSCLAMLLPSLRGQGLCSYALVHFLLMKQNEFLQQYYHITGKEMSR